MYEVMKIKILQLLSEEETLSVSDMSRTFSAIPYGTVEGVLYKMSKEGYVKVIDGEHGKLYSTTHKGTVLHNSVLQQSQQPQSQASLSDQLNQLIILANKAGLYDAADWVKAVRER